MKKIVILLASVPFLAFAQTKKKPEIKPIDGFVITANVTGYPNGTTVSFINDQTGQPEKQATIQNGKFVIKGQVPQPSFKVLVFGDQPPGVPLFLDNSDIKINGDKTTIEKLSVTGSPSHTQYLEYANAIQPYMKIFGDDAAYDSNAVNEVEKISVDFVKKHTSSYVAPLAIIRLYQATQNGIETEQLYKLMTAPVQSSGLGQYVSQQIQESKINAIGSVVKDFSQNDTSGNAVKISSFRGKYVLLDFWASWCRPCRMENPNVLAAYNKFHDKNFTVLSVSLDQAKPAWLDAIKMDGLTWNHVSDLKGWNNEVAGMFQIRSIPQNLLIDPDGKIIAKNLRGPLLENKLTQILR